jgi:tricorn protease
VKPDIRVDNEPHQTFLGRDAQLEAAIAYLQRKIAQDPPHTPGPPEPADKSFEYPERK